MNLLDIITAIRESHPSMVYLYTEGQCYNFHKIIKSIVPEAEPYYSDNEGHVYSKINGDFYDIRGLVTPPDDITPLYPDSQPELWGTRDQRRLVQFYPLVGGLSYRYDLESSVTTVRITDEHRINHPDYASSLIVTLVKALTELGDRTVKDGGRMALTTASLLTPDDGGEPWICVS